MDIISHVIATWASMISLKNPRISCDEVVHTVQYHRENKQGDPCWAQNTLLFFRNAIEALSKCHQAFFVPTKPLCCLHSVILCSPTSLWGLVLTTWQGFLYVAGDLLQSARRPDRGMSDLFLFYLDILKAMTVSMYMRPVDAALMETSRAPVCL